MLCQSDARLLVLAIIIFVVVLHVLMCAAASVNEVAAQPRDLGREPRYRRVCYYTNWSQYRKEEGRFLPANIDPFLCTHLVFAFAKVDNRGQLAPYEWNDIQYPYLYRQFNDLKKKNPHLKTLLAVGGWTHGSGPFTQMVRNTSDRRIFLDHAVQYLRTHGFDGLDLDWEYPASRGSPPEDKDNFSFLIKELHEGFKNEAERTGQPRLLLTAAVAGGEKIIKTAYDVPKVDKYLDFINLMSYDFHGSWSNSLGHNAPLYGGDFSPEESSNTHSVDEAVRVWLELGASREKLVVGIPFYGRSFTTCGSDVKPGMRNCGTGKSGPYTMENGFISFYEMEDKLASGWQRVWLDREKVPYAYHLPTKQWVGYDDVESITIKAQYIKDNGLGGAMVWSLDLDDFAPIWSDEPYPLGRTIRSILDRDVEYPKFKPPPIPGKKRKPSAAKKRKEEKEELIATKVDTKTQGPLLQTPKPVNSKPSPLDRLEMKEHMQKKLKLLDSDLKNKVRPDSPLMGLAPTKASVSTTTTSTSRPTTGIRYPSATTVTTKRISTVSTTASSTSRVSEHSAKSWTKRPEEKVATGDMRGETTRHRESPPTTSPVPVGSTDRTSPSKRWQENSEQRLWHFIDVPYKASATVKPAKFSGASTTRTTMSTTSGSLTSSPRSSPSEKVRHTTTIFPSPSTWQNPRSSEQSSSTVSSAHSSVFSTHSTVMPSVSITFSSSDRTLTTRDFNVKATQPSEAKWWEKKENNDGDKQESGDMKVSPSASVGLTTTPSRAATQEQRKTKWWNHVTKATTISSSTVSTASSPLPGSSTLQTSSRNGQSLGDVVTSDSIPITTAVSSMKRQNSETRPLPLSTKVDQAHPSEPSRTPDSVATQKLPRSDDEAAKDKPVLTIHSSVKSQTHVSSLRSANTTTAVPVAEISGGAVRYMHKEIGGTDVEVRTPGKWPSSVKPPVRTIISVDVKSRGDTPLDTGNLVYETQDGQGGKYVVNGQRTDAEVKGKHPPANSIFSRMTTTTREIKASQDAASSSLTTTSPTTSTTLSSTTTAAPTSATTTRWWERTTHDNVTSHVSTSTSATASTVKSTLLSSTTGSSPSVKDHTQAPGEWTKMTQTPAASTAFHQKTSVTWSSVSRRHIPDLNVTVNKTKAATVSPGLKFSSRLPVSTSTPSSWLSTSPAVPRTSSQGEDRSGSTGQRLRAPRPSSGTSGGIVQNEGEDEVLRSVENVKMQNNGEDWQARRTWWHRTGKPVRVEVRGNRLMSSTQRLEDTTKKCDPDAQVEQFKATGSEPDSMRAGVEVTYDVGEVKSPSHVPHNNFDETPIEAVFYPDYQEYEFQCPTVFGIYADPLDCARFYQCVWLVAFHHVCGPGTVWNDEMKICDWPTAFSCRS